MGGGEVTEYRTVRELAEGRLCSEATIRKWVKDGKLRAFRPGKKILIRMDDFRRFIESSKVAIQLDPDVRALVRGMFGR
jgi:excisionase family DNA binding protein